MASVSLQGLSKSYGSTAVLRDVNLDIRDGEFLTLVGPSGCGKTTLLRILAGLDHADAGTVRIGERVVDALPPKRRDVAMVFQSYALYPYMTVRENIAMPLAMRRLDRVQRLPLLGRWWPGARTARREIDQAVQAAAEPLGLQALLERRPAQLSGGQRQRVALARAMVRQPQVFLMDEPLSNLDAKLRVATRAEIAQLHRRLGATFVYVTHDQVEAMTMSDRVAMMMDGELLQLATPQELYDDPADLRVAEFIGTPKVDILAAVVAEGSLDVVGTSWPLDGLLPAQGRPQLAVRPEWWRLQDAAGPAVAPDSSEGRVRGTLAHVELLGSETLLHLGVTGIEAPVVARVAPSAARGLRIGQPLAFATRRVLVFGADGRRLRGCRWSGGRPCEAEHD